MINLAAGIVCYLAGMFIGNFGSQKEDERYMEELKGKGFLTFEILFMVTFLLMINIFQDKILIGDIFNICYLSIVAGLLSVSAYIDIKIQELPDFNTVVFLAITILLMFIHKEGINIFSQVLIVVISMAIYYVMSYFGGLGFGDVKLLLPIMISLDLLEVLNFWLYALMCALIYVIPLAIYKKVKKQNIKGIKFAFGPYIIIGFILFSIFGGLI